MKKIIIPLLMLIFICGCSSGIRITMDKKEYETEISTITAQIPRFSGMNHTELQEQLNTEYKTNTDGWISEFQAEADSGEIGNNKYVLDIEQTTKYNTNHFISMVTEVYRYTGGAHGMTAWLSKNIDDTAGKTIVLSDLFNTEDYKTILNRKMQELIETNKEEYQDLWEQPVITDNQEFYIQGGNITIYYPPYELSYYARGFVEFSIKLKDIEGYLKPDYKFLI